MKSISVVLPLLLTTASATEQPESHLRGTTDERELAFSSRKEGWLAAHNTRREFYHEDLGGTYSPLSWSNELKKKAATYAKSMAATCTPSIPAGMTYGINVNGRQGFNNLPTTESVVNGWESTIEDDSKNRNIVQALWSATKYVGCADSYNQDKKCSISVCLYAKVSISSCFQGNDY